MLPLLPAVPGCQRQQEVPTTDSTFPRTAQGWVWRELEQYKSRICEIGVDGHALYSLEGKDTWHGSACKSPHCRLITDRHVALLMTCCPCR